MNVGVPTTEITVEEERKSIISDGEILGIYGEIMDCIREDRKQVSDFIDTMAEMVINDGDATSSSKEALVNLVKIKSDMSDKMGKVADLMTRVKLKEKDTFPKYLAANQNNTINISEGASRRSLIEAINKAKKKKEQNV
jgi:cellobiose-specific phosphotransferase system component IIA